MRWSEGLCHPVAAVLIEWCGTELGAAGFEAVHAAFQGGEVCYERMDALVELGE